MRKFAKMSLVAAVAVAGLSSTLSAQPLEDAIKGVDVSGLMRYRHDAKEGSDQQNTYKLIIKTSSKVNDAVKANVTVGLNGEVGVNATSFEDQDIDSNPGLVIFDANFAFNIAGATVTAGKQSIPGPFVDNAVDGTDRGTGAVALVPAGPVTLAAGYFNNSNLAHADAYELAIMGKFGDVSADVWYMSLDNTAVNPLFSNSSAYSAHVTAPVAGVVNVDARYTSKDNGGADDATLAKLVVSGKAGPVTLAAGYLKSGKNNGNANGISVGDNDSATDAKVWQASMGTLTDATGVLVAAGMNLTPELNAKLTYIDVSCDAVKDASEALLDVSYAMSKNFIISGKYSTYEVGTADTVKTRLQVQYTF